MTSVYFILGLAVFMFTLLGWGFITLPKEQWQMVAALPTEKCGQGQWKGVNLTWYGLLSANAYTFGVAMAMVLAASARVPIPALGLITLVLLGVTLPASRIIARLVEKKQATLTVGGAVFAGTLTAPWLITLVNHTLAPSLGGEVPVWVMLSALSIGYTFGEALGRLACLSFGCCYGKPLCQCSSATRRIFSRFNVVFTGKTKKVAYASGLDGEKMIPIQIITAVIYTTAGLAGTGLFLGGMPVAALLLTLVTTQVWRVVSEFFRADFRGAGKFSAYQVMALVAVAYTGLMGLVFPGTGAPVDLSQGVALLWTPGMILFLQAIWVISFVHAGKSSVTASRIAFHVVSDKI